MDLENNPTDPNGYCPHQMVLPSKFCRECWPDGPPGSDPPDVEAQDRQDFENDHRWGA